MSGYATVASGIETVLQDVLQHIGGALDKDILHERTPSRAGDIKRSVARVDRARELSALRRESRSRKD